MLFILEACISSEEYNYDRLGMMRITIEWSITVSLGQVYTTIKKCLFVCGNSNMICYPLICTYLDSLGISSCNRHCITSRQSIWH